jgi:hypothetical protein
MISPCCGQNRARKWRKTVREHLPENPKVAGGIKLVYLGSGRAELIGRASGGHYHVSDHRRHFVAAPEDVDQLVRRKDVMMKP